METITTPAVVSKRKKEIVKQYLAALDNHIADLKAGRADEAYEIQYFAQLVHVHPVHLSSTIKEVTGKTTCDLFEERLVKISKELLISTDMSIGEIARQLTYDPSNFTKFFKHFTGTTPKQFRNSNAR